MSLQGKVALVTGGGRGIGAATATLLAARGAVNYLSNAQAAEGVVTAIRAASGEVYAVQADVRDAHQVARLVASVIDSYGRLDILVSNAAMRGRLAPFEQMGWEEFAQRVNDELKAAFELTQAVLPAMTSQHYGRLVYVGSQHANGPRLAFLDCARDGQSSAGDVCHLPGVRTVAAWDYRQRGLARRGRNRGQFDLPGCTIQTTERLGDSTPAESATGRYCARHCLFRG